jgi:hypothetical protein
MFPPARIRFLMEMEAGGALTEEEIFETYLELDELDWLID